MNNERKRLDAATKSRHQEPGTEEDPHFNHKLAFQSDEQWMRGETLLTNDREMPLVSS